MEILDYSIREGRTEEKGPQHFPQPLPGSLLLIQLLFFCPLLGEASANQANKNSCSPLTSNPIILSHPVLFYWNEHSLRGRLFFWSTVVPDTW